MQIRSAKIAMRLIMTSSLLRPGGERGPNCCYEPIPALRLFAQPFPAFASELIIFRAPIIIRLVPLGLEQPLPDEPKQGGIKRALFNEKRSLGNLADPEKNAVAVERPERNGFQNEEVERARQKFSFITHRVVLLS